MGWQQRTNGQGSGAFRMRGPVIYPQSQIITPGGGGGITQYFPFTLRKGKTEDDEDKIIVEPSTISAGSGIQIDCLGEFTDLGTNGWVYGWCQINDASDSIFAGLLESQVELEDEPALGLFYHKIGIYVYDDDDVFHVDNLVYGPLHLTVCGLIGAKGTDPIWE